MQQRRRDALCALLELDADQVRQRVQVDLEGIVRRLGYLCLGES